MAWSVLIVASLDDARLEATRRSLADHTDDIVVVDGRDAALARTEAARRAKHPVMLCLEPGELFDASSATAIAAFAAGGAPAGAICIMTKTPEATTRRWEIRLVRRGTPFAGSVVDRPLVDAFTMLPVVLLGSAIVRDVAALRAEVARTPADGFARFRLAEALVTSDPAAAVEHGAAALESLPLDALEAPSLVLVVATALARAGQHADLVGLAASCQERWPRFTELRLRQALAFRALGEIGAAFQTLEACIELGEDTHGPGTVGAGTFLAWYHLGALAEAQGDLASARAFHGRALGFGAFAPALARVRALDDLAVSAVPVPVRLTDDGTVAQKACRHGTMRYFVKDRFVGRALDVYGEWCEAELDILGALVAPGDTVLDVGANIGTHTLFFGNMVGPSGRVVALEPQRIVHALLSQNMKDNALDHVECLLAAADAEVGTVMIPVADPNEACNFGGIAVGDAAARSEEIPATSIDALDLGACSLIKIDVEGLETRVLSGAANTVARHRPVLFVENNTLERSRDILSVIAQLGYRAYWHVSRYYRSDNFFGNPVDIFAPYQPEANLVCIPEEAPTPAAVGELEPVLGLDDDFVQAIGRMGSARLAA